MLMAHFSDFHLGARSLTAQVRRMRALVDHALESGAEHLMFSGDLVDHGNAGDAQALADHLSARGMFNPDGFSMVFGNHDVWPISAQGNIAERAVRWFVDHAAALVVDREPPGQRNYDELTAMFAPAFEGASRMDEDDPFPCVKRVGPVAFGMLDTTADTVFEHARGRFDETEAEWLDEKLRQADGTPLLLLHHWPFAWEVDVPDTDELVARLPFLLRKAVEGLFDMDEVVAGLVDVKYGDLKGVQAFIRRSTVQAVFCGHLHSDGGPRSSDFTRSLGRKPVYCMGRSGAIDQDDGREYAYHLINAKDDTIAVKTVYVSERELDRSSTRRRRTSSSGRATATRRRPRRPIKK